MSTAGGGLQRRAERGSRDADDDEEAWDAAAAAICAGADKLPDLLRKPDASGAKDERLSATLTWRHACFLDAITADSQLAAVVTPLSPPPSMTPSSSSTSEAAPRRLRLTAALHFVRDLLAAAPSLALPPELIESAVAALAHSAQLAALVPVGLSTSEGSRKLLEFISQLTDRLRRVEEAGSGWLLVPIGWLNTATGASPAGRSPATPANRAAPAELLLAMHRFGTGWDVAVCSASSGLGYHPSYPTDEAGETAQHDPILLFRHVRADNLLDSAPWFLLYRQLAFKAAAPGAGARALYEIVLPFLAGRSVPAAVRRDPPPPELRRHAAPLGDRTRAATALEGLRGLLLLGGASAADATLVTLRLRRMALAAIGYELRALREVDALCIGQHDHSLIAAGCRGLAAHAAAAAALPLRGESGEHQGRDTACGALGSDAGGLTSTGVPRALELAGEGEGESGLADGSAGGREVSSGPDPLTRFGVSAATEAELLAIARLVGSVNHLADALHARALGSTPPALCLPVTLPAPSDARHGLFSRLRRLDDVKRHAGVAPHPPFLRPVRLTSVAERVSSVAEVSTALQQALTQCTLLASQAAGIKNSGCIRVSLLEHLFTAVIPLPLPLDAPDRPTRCFWHTARVGFLEQAGLVRLVGALAQHYAAASLCLTLTREHDGARIVTLACMAALLDALLRLQAADLPSLLSRHYAGAAGEVSAPFGIDAGRFAEESQNLKLVAPELAVSRAMLLDYFQSVRRAAGASRRVYSFEQPGGFGEGELALVGQLASEMGLGDEGRADERARMLTGESAELMTLCPELATCRDVAFLLKLLMTPTADGLPPRKRWLSSDARLTWAHAAKGGGLTVRGFGRELDPAFVEAKADRLPGIPSWLFGGRSGGARARVPTSQAVPSALLSHLGLKEEKLSTEEAILFLTSEELHGFQAPDDDDRRGKHASGGGPTDRPTAAHMLSARDAELLLQYLTAPYLRIPLLLSFFADPVRVQALAQPRMQELLEACLFEPGPWQQQATRPMPEAIPVPRDLRAEMLCTPLGLLFNELALAPPSLLLPHVRRMLAAALDMDTGTSESASAAVIFFVVRLAVRVEAYVDFFLQHGEWRKEVDGACVSGVAGAPVVGGTAGGVKQVGGMSGARAGSEAAGGGMRAACAEAVAAPAGTGTVEAGVGSSEGGAGQVKCSRVLSSHRSAAAILHVPRGDRAPDRRAGGSGAAGVGACATPEGTARSDREEYRGGTTETPARRNGAADEFSSRGQMAVETRMDWDARDEAAGIPPKDVLGDASKNGDVSRVEFRDGDTPGNEDASNGYATREGDVSRDVSPKSRDASEAAIKGDLPPVVAAGRGDNAPEPESSALGLQGMLKLPQLLSNANGGTASPILATPALGVDQTPNARLPPLAARRAATCSCISLRSPGSAASATPAGAPETRPTAGASLADDACAILADEIDRANNAAAPGPPPPPLSLCGPHVVARGLETTLDSSRVSALRDEVRMLRARLDGDVCALLSAWFEKSLSKKDVRGACVVIAHLALLFQNTPEHALDTRACSWLLAAHVFLTHNFEWDTELPVDAPSAGGPRAAHTQQTRRAAARDLRIPQTQLFDLWQRHRHALLRRMSDPARSAERGVVMAHVVRAVACTSPSAATGAEETEPWREMSGDRNAGRFVLDYNAEGRDRQHASGGDSGAAGAGGGGVPTPQGAFEEWLRRECSILPTQQEINLQLGEYHASVARKQLEVLHASFVDFADFRSIFGQSAKPSSFQSAEVEATQQRTWLRLVHRRHELHRWAAPPPDFAPPAGPHTQPYLSWMESVERRVESVVPFMRGASSNNRKAWLRELLEPVRLCHFGSLHLFLPPLDESFSSAPAALLTATAGDGTPKEIVVLRQPACVMVYDLVEHGRRWYRVLAFCSRADCSLASLPVRLSRPENVSILACGDAMEPTAAAESLVITRHVGPSLVGIPPFLPAAAPAARGAPAQQRPPDRPGGWGDYGNFLTRHLHFTGSGSSPAPAARPVAPPILTNQSQSTHAAIEQTFVPSRLLRGLLPEALLESHHFWQNEDDSLSGYPRGGREAQEPGVQPTVLLISLEPGALPPDVPAHGPALATVASGDASGVGPAPDRHASAAIRRRRVCYRSDTVPSEARRGREGVGLDATLADDMGWEEAPGRGNADELLLNLLHPDAPPAVAALAALFRRVEDVSHVLAWARMREGADERGRGQAETAEWALASVELPRLRLAFDMRPGAPGGEPKLHCREHAGYFISNAAGQPAGSAAQPDEPSEDAARAHSLRELIASLPHALVLEDGQGDLAVLVSAAAKPFWPAEQAQASGSREGRDDAGTCLLHRSDKQWLAALPQARHYLYTVHPSLHVLCSRTLASSLYLLLLHLSHRRYDAVLKLADACMADTRLSAEEEQLWQAIEEAGNVDQHPEAHAARLKVWLVLWRWRFESPIDHPHSSDTDASSNNPSVRSSFTGPAAATPPSRPNAVSVPHSPATTPHSQRGRRAPPTAGQSASFRLGSWDVSAALESYVLHRRMVRANCRLQAEEELALLSRHLGALAASRETLTPHAAQVAAELAAYHDALLDAAHPTSSETPLTRARPRFRHVFPIAPPGPSPLASAVWFDGIVHARALLSPFDEVSPAPALPLVPSILKAPSSHLAQGFTGEAALKQAHTMLDSLSLESHFVPLYELITGWHQLTLHAERDSSCLMGALLLRCLPPEDWQASQPLVALLDLLTHQRDEMREGVPRDQLDDGLAARLPHYDELKSVSPEEAQADLAIAQVEGGLSLTPRAGRVRVEPVVSPGGPDESRLAALWRQLQGDDTARRLVKHAALALLDSQLSIFPDNVSQQPARLHSSPESTPSQQRVRGDSFPRRVTARWLVRPLRPGDSSCCERELQAPMADFSAGGHGGSGPLLRVGAGELEALATQPLQQLGLDSLVEHVPRRKASCLPDPPKELSDVLDVDNHPYARTRVATELLHRLDVDVRGYAAAWEQARTPQLLTLQPEEVSECVQRALLRRTGSSLFGSKLEKSLRRLSEIETKLLRLRAHDASQTEEDIRRALSAANCNVAPGSTRAELDFALRQLAGEEARADFADIAVQLLSSSAEADLGRFNPHLSARRGAELLQLMAVVLLRTSRRAFLASAITAARGLRMGLLELHELGAGHSQAQAARTALELQNKAAQLAERLCTHRSIARVAQAEPGATHPASPPSAASRGLSMGLRSPARAESEATPTFVYDPRFLVFESISMLILREEQVHLVRDFVTRLSRNDPTEKRAVVSQLIMGAGKTTIILPLLALLLADGSQLIIQVVPATLLTFTRAVLRERFSSFVSKPIYTFAFDRSTIPAPALVDKLRDAERSGGLVCSTPTAVKSFALAFVHLMHQLDYNLRRHLQRTKPREGGPTYLRALDAIFGRQHSHGDAGLATALHEQVRVCCEVMSIFDRGVLMLDEVDLILHPLRSELNWPLGKRLPLDFTSEKHALGMRWELPLHLLDPLHYAGYGECVMQVPRSRRSEQLLQRIKCAVDRGCEERAMTRQPHLQLLEPRFYEDHLRPLLALWLLLYIVKLGVKSLDEEEMRAWIEHGQPPRKGKATALERDAWQVKLLNLSHELLVTTLPFVLSKVNRVTYGLLSAEQIETAHRDHGHVPKSRRLLAVPFVGKDTPSLASEFSHPDVLISLTILAYSHEGLRDSDVRAALEALHDEMQKQFGPYNARPALHTYIQWVEGAGARVRGMRQPAGATARSMPDGSSPGCDASHPSTPVSALRLGTRPGTPRAGGGAMAGGGWPASAGTAMAAPPLREVWPLHLIEWDNAEQMSVLFSLLRRQPEVIRYYLVNEQPKEEPRGVFRRTMQFQNLKLCASGQEIGGDVLFGRRMGFSGTPNNLLPEELGKCRYSPGDDARMLHVLTSPSVVEARRLTEEWSVLGLLEQVATWTPPVHALIDTGALVTGLSNVDVARKLLEAGLPHVDGVVFMDASGCKMILVREGMQILKLEQCGLPPSRRFSFYDQVHTTGIDIEQPAAAAAALTLGKDMTFRDYAQGAFRMRGIGRGQRIEVLITPEVHQLINDAVAKSTPQRLISSPPPAADDLRKRVVQWLHVNTMRSESLQFHLLCDQSLSNVWRKAAFLRLREAHAGGRADAGAWTKDLENAIDIFRTKVALGVSDEVPGGYTARNGGAGAATGSAAEPAAPDSPPALVPSAAAPMTTAGGTVRNDRGRVSVVMGRDGGVEIASTFLTEPGQVAVCNRITARLGKAEAVESERMNRHSGAGARTSGGGQQAPAGEPAFEALGARAAQEEDLEQQQECQQEEEREQQQQTIVVRSELDEPPSVVLDTVGPHDFSRDVAAPQAWGVRALLDPPAAGAGDASPFYALSDLRLRGPHFAPLRFPPSLLLSRNYFQPVWFTAASHRRMKNVIMLLDWTPGSQAPASAHEPAAAFDQEAEARLAAAWELLAGGDNEGGISVDELEGLLVAEGLNSDAAAEAAREQEGGKVTFEAARRALAQHWPAEARGGRYLLAVSLEEAEGVRALLHGLQARGQLLLDGGATLALRHGEELFEASAGYAAGESDQQALAARQCFRLFDCEVNFTPREVTATLRALQENPPEARVRWFEAVRACRRRERRDWRAAPIARVFHTLDHAQLVQEEAVRHKVAGVLRKNRVHPATFFAECDVDHDGVLSERDLKNGLNALEGLRIEPAQFDILVRRLDADRDGSISRPEWCALFADGAGGGQEALVREADLAPLDEETEPEGERADFPRGAGRTPSDTTDRPRAAAVEIPVHRLLKLQVRLHPLGRGARLAWSTRGLPTQKKLSLWAPEVKTEIWSSNKHRFCVGHYGHAGLDRPPVSAGLSVIELEDVTQWHVVKGPWLDAALAQNAPHPEYFRLEWRKESVEPPIYAWRPVPPPGGEYVALGMVFTTSHDPPARSVVRCVHRRWVRPSRVEPECLWNDSGLGGEAGSVWRISDMQLVVATKGHTRPAGPFYELIDTPFTLLEVAAARPAGRTTSAPGSPRTPAPAMLTPLPAPSRLPPPAVSISLTPSLTRPATANYTPAAPPTGSSQPRPTDAAAPAAGGGSTRTPSTRGAAETPSTSDSGGSRGIGRSILGEETPVAEGGSGSPGSGSPEGEAGDGMSDAAQATPGPASSVERNTAESADPE